MLVLGIYAETAFAQKRFEMADYTAGIDSFTSEKTVKDLLFSCGSDFYLTKDGAPIRTESKNHKLIVRDNRIKVEAGTVGRVVDIQIVKVGERKFKDPDAEIDVDSTVIQIFIKVYWVQFDTETGVATVPFVTGAFPSSDTPFTPYLGVYNKPKADSFMYNDHVYELDGSITLQLPKKQLDALKLASGYGF